jgi:CRISPR-associated protein Csd1
MNWMVRLAEAYDNSSVMDGSKPWPLSHFMKNAHVEVVIDGDGNFKFGRVKILEGEDSQTLIPATESSAGRAGAKIAPHPLCDELSYCAGDMPKLKIEKFEAYINQLKQWNDSEYSHKKVSAVFNYLKKSTLWSDLQSEIQFPVVYKNKSGQSTKIDLEKTFIRWRVEDEGDLDTGTWEDETLIEKWILFDGKYNATTGFCFAEGKTTRAASNHSRFIRNAGDGAKIISSNDESGFTYRGRFFTSSQSVEIGFNLTQKAHNALRWLVSRQGIKNGDQVVIAFAVSGKKIPDAFVDLDNLWDLDNLDVVSDFDDITVKDGIDHSTDIGQSFARNLNRYMSGFRADLNPTENIIIMAIDSATPGRMGIVYYRDYLASEYLSTIERWHSEFAWPQRVVKEIASSDGKKNKQKVIWVPYAPSPYAILNTAYGDIIKSSDSLKKNLYERLIPCLVEGIPFPKDLVDLAIHRASNPNACEKWEWEKNIGIACSLYRGFYNRHPIIQKRRNYSMSLENDNRSRDYLYGRLLAIAERIEEVALNVAGENRPVTAVRLMQRFADRPFSTWRTLELALLPYMQRLQNSRAGFLVNRKKELDEVLGYFNSQDFTNDKALSGEFLLGFHCQRLALRNKQETDTEQN